MANRPYSYTPWLGVRPARKDVQVNSISPPYWYRAGATLTLCLAALYATTDRAAAAGVSMSWAPGEEEERIIGYKVYYDVDSGVPYEGTVISQGPSPIDLPVEDMDDPLAPSVELTGLPSCVRYYFALTAYSETGESDLSNEVDLVVLDGPRDLAAAVGEPGEVALSWSGLPDDDDGEVASYRVSWDVDAGEPYEGAGSPVVVTELYADIDTLEGGVTHYFVVESLCPDGTFKFSDEVTAVPAEEPEREVEEPAPAPDSGGCSCQSMPGSAPLGWLGVFGLALAALSRRSGRSSV